MHQLRGRGHGLVYGLGGLPGYIIVALCCCWCFLLHHGTKGMRSVCDDSYGKAGGGGGQQHPCACAYVCINIIVLGKIEEKAFGRWRWRRGGWRRRQRQMHRQRKENEGNECHISWMTECSLLQKQSVRPSGSMQGEGWKAAGHWTLTNCMCMHGKQQKIDVAGWQRTNFQIENPIPTSSPATIFGWMVVKPVFSVFYESERLRPITDSPKIAAGGGESD